MKKIKGILCLLLACCMVFCLAACQGGENSSGGQAEGTTQPATSAPTDSQDSEGKVLVAYFSATGNTKGVAEKIAGITGGDLYEIVPADPYTSEDLDYGNDQSRSSAEMDDPNARPEIGGEPISLEGYTTLYLGYPIWHGQAPRIMSTFVERYDLDGITVVPFCTSGSSSIGSSAEQLAELAGSGTWLDGERFSSSVSESDLRTWIDGLE